MNHTYCIYHNYDKEHQLFVNDFSHNFNFLSHYYEVLVKKLQVKKKQKNRILFKRDILG